MRHLRFFVGLFITIAALGLIVREQMAGASANAFVNARLVDLRAPISGVLDMPRRTLGTRVSVGETLVGITDPLAQTQNLHDLRFEQHKATTHHERLEARLDRMRAQEERLQAAVDQERAQARADLRIQLDAATARVALLPAALPDDALAANRVREERDRLQAEWDSFETAAGTFTTWTSALVAHQDAYARLQDEADTLDATIDALATRLDIAQIHASRLSRAVVASPVSGILWDVIQPNAVFVQRGDPLVTLVDCASTVVTLSVTEGVYNSLSIGQSATFRLAGDGSLHPATITRLAGSGAGGVYEHMAITPGPRHMERYDVLLSVPSLLAGQEASCLLGRTGRAYFKARPFDRIRSFLRG